VRDLKGFRGPTVGPGNYKIQREFEKEKKQNTGGAVLGFGVSSNRFSNASQQESKPIEKYPALGNKADFSRDEIADLKITKKEPKNDPVLSSSTDRFKNLYQIQQDIPGPGDYDPTPI